MKETSALLSASDFFDRLRQDKLDAAAPFSLTGMVKKSEGKQKTIEFALGAHCANWVTIPLELIESVEVLRTVSCKDHSHPLVRLHMKAPHTAEGKMLYELLQQQDGSAAGMEPGGGAMELMRYQGGSVPGGGGKGTSNFICGLRCKRYSTLIPGLCNEWVWDCGYVGGPIVIIFIPVFLPR